MDPVSVLWLAPALPVDGDWAIKQLQAKINNSSTHLPTETLFQLLSVARVVWRLLSCWIHQQWVWAFKAGRKYTAVKERVLSNVQSMEN